MACSRGTFLIIKPLRPGIFAAGPKAVGFSYLRPYPHAHTHAHGTGCKERRRGRGVVDEWERDRVRGLLNICKVQVA